MNTTYTWYSTLIKPAWAPPSWLFGPVWTVLYAIIFVSFGYVFYRVFKGELSYLIALPFLLNLAFNAAFTPLQFGLRSNGLAALDIVLVLITLVWALIVIYPHAPWVSYVNLPYLAWVLFATALQLTITYLNW
ncbi:tryptophan-rich sensory protein [Patescibacteria group bacterium]|nr:tryptophan-rich sensory protein [Patescibacteria group bacterium]